ncbi:hypothetical protein GCM10008107_09730 [Psychrosphaera saromensis]|uniref:Uncharacterized protein n=1 Tax=Psychrosphaera saromensis TaxID=716813 RepID=A0A2S7UWU2_9GAMM|nr:hypothetical protein [Psychrosphaera saromensis]PQJ53740.1 hypothetical protein BTO11_08740 [Psychrosphaera saromensis]GHB62683.1 hypothetical protein GCM10008107_09730 [Psychrosphaera saromensis]GLQ15476.1 hypothetical protein GCM10007917_29310 [Psychrosphaera saromensis]
MLTRKYAAVLFFACILSVLFLSGCASTTTNSSVALNPPISMMLSPQYRSCIANTPSYLLTSEGIGLTEQAAATSARASLVQQIKVDVKVDDNLQLSKSDTLTTNYQLNASTQSAILLTNSIVLCKEFNSNQVRVFVGYDNRNLDMKLQSVLTKRKVEFLSQLRGSRLLIHSNVFKHLDSSKNNKNDNRQLIVSLSRKNDIWYFNIGNDVIALTPEELIKLTSFENVGEISLIARSGQIYKDNRLKNGDVFKIKYIESLSDNSYFSMFIQAEDGSVSLLYENLKFHNGAIELPEIQACMSYDDDGGCQSLSGISKDKLIAITSNSRIDTLQIEQMQHSYNQNQAVNRYQLPELIASLSEVENVNITSAFVFVTPYNN